MNQLKVIEIAAKLAKEGKTNAEIEKVLFNTKGTRVSQIKKVMELMEPGR